MKTFYITILCSILTLSVWEMTLARPQEIGSMLRPSSEYAPNENKREPTCEELRAMWRFSRRQVRGAEVTNEIPTFRDPFSYNIWEQYPRVRSAFSLRPSRPWSKPVYGRVIQNVPPNHPRLMAQETKPYDELLRKLDRDRPGEGARKKYPDFSYRLSGRYTQPSMSSSGSFQKLKQLILAERARELQEQRNLEENAAHGTGKTYNQFKSSRGPGRRPTYKFPDQESKEARIRTFRRKPDFDDSYTSNIYMEPYREEMAFNSEPSDERIW